MQDQLYSYIIVGAGLSGVSAAEGIRQLDPHGSILLLGAEKDVPYDRPPLSKQLRSGGKSFEENVLHDERFYKTTGIELRLGIEVTHFDAAAHTLRDSQVDAACALIERAAPVTTEGLRGAIRPEATSAAT